MNACELAEDSGFIARDEKGGSGHKKSLGDDDDPVAVMIHDGFEWRNANEAFI